MCKILSFIKLPPPITGVTMLNEYIFQSKLLNESFDFKTIPVSYNKTNTEFGQKSFLKVLVIISLIFRLIKGLLYYRPKLVYFQLSPVGEAFIRDLIFVTIIKFFRKKILFHLHGIGIKDQITKKPFYKPLYNYCFKNASIICLSELVINDIEDVYADEPFIVYNGIKPSTHAYPEIKTRSKAPVLLFLSNLIRFKGLEDFIAILKNLNEGGIDFKAKIIGKESDITEIELKSLIQGNRLEDKVEYLGSRYGEKKYIELQSSDILIYPTRYDAWGLVILEAMKLGIPVVATNVGSIPIMIEDGVNGFIVEAKNIEQLTEKTLLLINNPKLRIQMGTNNKTKFKEKFTDDIFEHKILQVFKSVLTSL